MDTLAQLAGNGQLSPSAVVTVNTVTGLFDVNLMTTSIGELVTNDGTAQTGGDNTSTTGGTLTVAGLDMNGGVLDTQKHGTVILAGTAQGTSDATTGFGIIKGSGTFSLGGKTRTFDLTRGVSPVDMDVQLPITGPGNVGLVMSGTGILELDANNTATYTGVSTVTGGQLQVDGKIDNVALAGGTVSGVGQIGDIVGGAGGPTGTINPGDNGALVTTGVLTTNTGAGGETWGSNTTLAVDLNNLSNQHPNPTVGTDYDQLVVNGNLNLGGTGSGAQNGGATLAGAIGANVEVGDKFTIIQTTGGGVISGRFAEPYGEDASGNGIDFIGGVKFLVVYSPTTLVVDRQPMPATLTITSSLVNNTSVYGQPIQFTANMIAEAGAGALPTTDYVTFTLMQGSTVLTTQKVNLDASGNAVFNPQATTTYAAGTYTVSVAFHPDPNFTTPPAATLTPAWTVDKDPTKLNVTVSDATPVIGETVVVTATAVPQAPGDQTTGAQNPTSPTPNVTFTIGGAVQTPVKSLDSSGATQFSFIITALGSVTIVAAYTGDGNYKGSSSSTTAPVTVVGQKDLSTVTILANPTSPALVGQSVTFTAVVSTNSPGTVTPNASDTVLFTDTIGSSTISLGSQPVKLMFNSQLGKNVYEAIVTSSTLALGTHTISAAFTGDSLIDGDTGTIPYVVNLIPTATTLTTSKNPAILAQQVLFTATVTATGATGPGSGAISGTVNFYDASVSPSKLLGTANVNGSGQALFTDSSLAVGSHTIYATYAGNGSSYAGDTSSNTVIQSILYGDTTTVASSLDPATYGQTEVFTATVAPVPGTPALAGTPAGTVDFYDGTTLLKAGVPLNASGVATFSTASLSSPLAIGTNNIIAYYNNSSNQYIPSQGSFSENIQSGSTTTLATSVNPTGPGLPVTFTATIAPVAPGMGNPDGQVTFSDGGTTLGTVTVNTATGTATFTTSSLALGKHTITASYGGSTGYAPSSSAVLTQTVIYADTTTLVSSLNPSPVGGSVTFTATVAAASNTPGGINPTGTITFYDGATALKTVNLAGNETATYSTATLSAAAHAITAVYSGNANFITTTSPVLTQNVLSLTKTTVATSKTPTVYSEPVTFTVTVAPTISGQPTPTGTVTLFDGATSIGSGTLSGGTLTFTPSVPLTVAVHSITAVYTTSASYYTSTSPAITQTVNQDGTSISVASSLATSVYTEPVTFTAQVIAASPGTAVPTGTVTFFDNTGSGPVSIGTANVDASTGVATFSPTTPLAVGTHTITASFGQTTNFIGSTSAGITQQVNGAQSATALTLVNNPAVYGQSITIDATVTPVFPAAGTPAGTVTFFDNTGSGPVSIGTASVNASTGIAALSPSSPLPVGANQITASFVATTGFSGSSASAQTETITAADTQTVLAPVPTPSIFGQALTFTATVSAMSPGTGIPPGTVTFYDNTGSGPVAIGTGTVNTSTGQASFTTTAASPLPVGANSITASYGTTANYSGSTSAAQTQTVTAAGTTITVTSSSSLVGGVPTSVYSEPVVFTAQVTPATPGTPFPTGTVTFFDGSTAIGTGNINASTGQATFTPAPPLNVGTHSITANFGATSSYTGSTSAAITQDVNQDATSTVVSSSSTPVAGVPTAVFSQPVTFTAVVTPAAPARASPPARS